MAALAVMAGTGQSGAGPYIFMVKIIAIYMYAIYMGALTIYGIYMVWLTIIVAIMVPYISPYFAKIISHYDEFSLFLWHHISFQCTSFNAQTKH